MRVMTQIHIFLFALMLILCALPASASGEYRIGLIPFENLSDKGSAASAAMPLVEQLLRQKGYRVVSGGPVEEILEGERVRYLDSLHGPVLGRMTESLGVDGVVVGSVLSFSAGAPPRIAVSARLIAKTGEVVWGETVSMTGNDSKWILGLGRIDTMEELLPMAVERLFETFDPAGGKGGGDPVRLGNIFLAGPGSSASPALDPGSVQRIGILPLEIETGNMKAGRILMELLARRLRRTGRFTVIEPEEIRDARVKEEVFSLIQPNLPQLRKIGARLNARYLLRGSVYGYKEGITAPELELFLSMVDVETGKVVWTSHLRRNGEDYQTLLQFGLINNIISLADQMLREMADALIRGGGKQAQATIVK